LVSTVVNNDGTIDQSSTAVVHSVHPLLDAEAQRFVSEARLWPACRSGEPVRVRMTVPVVFDAGPKIPGVKEGFLIGLGVGLASMLVALASGK
jgi:TonB family protein